MGLFDCMCAESGLIIDSRQRLIPIVEVAEGTWEPIALAIAGTYDRYGTMDVPSKLDPNMKLFVELARTFAYRDDSVRAAKLGLKGVLDEIRGDGSGATWNGRAVSFALIDGHVFDAVVGVVKANGTTAWLRYAQRGLAKDAPATMQRLCKAIVDAPTDDGARKVFLDYLLERDDPRGQLLAVLPKIAKLSVGKILALALPHTHAAYAAGNTTPLLPQAIELLRFLAWGTRLVPAHGEGQFSG